ncbi:MAG: hypothetical protein R3B90_15485 [Planctomycetaceae bacterium]
MSQRYALPGLPREVWRWCLRRKEWAMRAIVGLLTPLVTSCPLLAKTIAIVFCAAQSLMADDVLLREDFERSQASGFYGLLVAEDTLQVVPRKGVAGTRGLEATYLGQQDGSKRIIVTQPLLQSATECTLCYDVQFQPGFQFVNGGRLHGIGPDNRVAGEASNDPDAWCARVRFRGDGTLQTSLFHQDQRQTAGDRGVKVKDFPLLPGRFYAVSLHVKLNDPEEANGFTRLYVNGTLVEERTEIRFREVGGEKTEIRHLMFNTFHDGHTRESAPRNPDGSYRQCRAVFDNLAVYVGEHVRERAGEE